jgi:hypothetical protein
MFSRRRARLEIQQLESRLALTASAVEHNGVGYFLQTGDPGFARYDIENEKWLDRVDLVGAAGAATFAEIDDDGIYVAFDSTVYRYNLDGTGQTHVLSTQAPVRGLHSDGNVLFINHSSGLYAHVVSVDKNTNQVISSFEAYIDALGGSSISRETNKLFGRSLGVSPADITYVTYTDNGQFGVAGDSQYHGDYPAGSRTWVFDGGQRVVDDTGTIYSSDLLYLNSFQSRVDDLDFVGGEIPVVLYNNTITAYSKAILPTGDKTLDFSASDIFVSDRSVIAFAVDATAEQGWRTEVVPLTALSAPQPGEPIDPDGLAFMPDQVDVAKDGTLLLFSKQHQSVFRFDPDRQTWGDSIPLIGVPEYMAYLAESNTIYLAYASGLIRQINLSADELAEVPFAALPQNPMGLAAAGKYVFAADPSGAWATHYTFAIDGTRIAAKDWNYYSREYIWSEVNQKMYFFRDDTSPNDLHYEVINADGSFGVGGDSPLHDSAGFVHPIRVAPNGSVVVLGSGAIHDAASLSRLPQSLGGGLTDIAWLGTNVVAISDNAGDSAVKIWSGATWGPMKTATVAGRPVALKQIGENRLLAVTLDPAGVPALTVLNENLAVVPRPAPVALAGADVRADIGSSIVVDGSLSYDPDQSSAGLTFAWAVVDGPSGGKFTAADSSKTGFAADTPGVYELQLTVSDGQYETVDTLRVTYRVNLAPLPIATAPEGIALRGPIALSSIGTTDPNGDAVTFAWSVVSGPVGAKWTLGANDEAKATLAADTPGDYQVKLTANDGVLTGDTTITVRFKANSAPTADATRSEATAIAGRRAARLDATASSDPERDRLAYRWEVVAGPQESNPIITDPTAAVTSFAATVAGEYRLKLTADDGLATNSQLFTVVVAPNQPPQANASRSTTSATFGSGPIRLDGTASTDADDASLNYEWRIVASSNGKIPEVASAMYAIAYFTPDAPGVYAVELVVRDGATSDSDYILVTVLGNQAPVADASRSDDVVVAGALPWLDATASLDPDGDTLTYEWSVVASSSATWPTVTDPHLPRTPLDAREEGNYAVRLAVSDGITTTTDFVVVTVRGPLVPTEPGDFNEDLRVDNQDVDLLASAIRRVSFAQEMDLNKDGIVSQPDYAFLVGQLLGAFSGDIDLNGKVDLDDFSTLKANFGKGNVGRAQGDLNGDALVDLSDFSLLKSDFGKQDVRVPALAANTAVATKTPEIAPASHQARDYAAAVGIAMAQFDEESAE